MDIIVVVVVNVVIIIISISIFTIRQGTSPDVTDSQCMRIPGSLEFVLQQFGHLV